MIAAINWTFKFGHTKTNAVLEAVQTQTNAVVETAQQITQNDPSFMTAALAAVLGFFAYPIVVGIFAVILSILFIGAAEHEDSDYDSFHGWSIFVAVIAVLVYCKQIFAFLGEWSWHFILLAVVAYGILGGLNSIFRWFKLCRKYVEIHPNMKEETYREQLQPSKYKGRLIGWIVYWPWSLFWNILGDFFTGIYDALANVYNRVAASVISKAIKH